MGGGGLFAVVADWCGFCKSLKKNVDEAQKIRSFDFYFLDADKSRAKVQEMGVPGFPMMYTIGKGGQLTEYNGGRNVKDLTENFSTYHGGSRGWFW